MKKLSEIYDLVRKGELKTGDVVTFVADVLTKKETDSYYFVTLTNGKNVIVEYYGIKKKKAISPLFKKLKIDKRFVIKGTLWCSNDCSEFRLDELMFASSNKAIYDRLKYYDTYNPLYKLCSYLENGSENAANKFFFSNKEFIIKMLHLNEDDCRLILLVCDEKRYKDKHHIVNKQILSELIKANLGDGFGGNVLMNFIYTVFFNETIKKHEAEIKLDAAKYLYEIIDEIPDDAINFIDVNGDNVVNLLCGDDMLSPIIEKLLNRNVSFNCVNDIGWDSLGEAIRHGSKTITKLIVDSGKVKVTDKHKKLADKYFVKL